MPEMCPIHTPTSALQCVHTEEKAMWGHSKEAVWKPVRLASPENNLASTLIWDFQPEKVWENKFLLFKPPVCGIFL